MFAEAFNAGDVDRMLALYEPEATLMPTPGPVRSGAAEIRETLQRFVAVPRRMTISTDYAIRMGEIALLRARWTTVPVQGKGAAHQGYSSEVARLQSDGRWLYIIDYPLGGSAP
ncbi:MAG TPA: nuclear transport factor 2 family protein [Candidatus Angelobacter sp.]|nr:nuclear transport factor 2 family protein [Candidatus Angelobacter sp.]